MGCRVEDAASDEQETRKRREQIDVTVDVPVRESESAVNFQSVLSKQACPLDL